MRKCKYSADEVYDLLFAICVSNGITSIDLKADVLNAEPRGLLEYIDNQKSLRFTIDVACLDVDALQVDKLANVLSFMLNGSLGGFSMSYVIKLLKSEERDSHSLREKIGLALSRLGYIRSTRTKKGNKREYLYTKQQ